MVIKHQKFILILMYTVQEIVRLMFHIIWLDYTFSIQVNIVQTCGIYYRMYYCFW